MQAPVSRTSAAVVSTMQADNVAQNGLSMPRVKEWNALPSIRASTGSNGINIRPDSALSYNFIRSPKSSFIFFSNYHILCRSEWM